MLIDSPLKTTITVLFLSLLTIPALSQNKPAEQQIHLNQIGFYPDAPKKAIIAKDISGSFYIASEDSDEYFFSDSLRAPKSQYDNGDIRVADFSSFNKPGTYRLFIPGFGYSYSFTIKSNIFRTIADASLKGYYYQRTSTALDGEFAGKWQRKTGHPDDSVKVHASAATAERTEGTVISSRRGWYDAGDYNKYIVNSGITMGTLLNLYEDFPEYSSQIHLNIPEKDNDIPDLLDEVLWNLRWMMTMQDPHDGGVYHKMTSAGFSGMVMPAEDTADRYMVQKSTAAALDFAAVMTQATRVFEDFDQQLPGLADSCRTAAKQAWQWARENPQEVYDQGQLNEQFNPDITTGAYGDHNLQDEFLWAAMELYVTTKDEKYYDAVELLSSDEMLLPSWGQVGMLGYFTLLRFENSLTEKAKQDIPKIKERVIAFADQMVEGKEQWAYETVMGYKPDHFIWGSNSVAANQGIALLQAYKLTSDKKYLNAAFSNLDYLLGRNATGYSFLTGYGDKTPKNPHHRPSEADTVRNPVPGLIVGGPNPGQQDDCNYPSDQPNKSYVDAECSYASNEIAINWNAPMVYLSYAIEALQYKGGYSPTD